MTSTADKELVERLRENIGHYPFMQEAADRLESLLAEVERLRGGLIRIAAFDDDFGNQRLARTGSYSSFDEPGSVQIARETLGESSPQLKE